MIYASFKTRFQAEAALEGYFAGGWISECELAPKWIYKRNGRYCIILKD